MVSADPAHLGQVESLVQRGRYRTVSEFVREAMAEKLARLAEEQLAEEVARYCDERSSADEDDEIVEWQALEEKALDPGPRRRGGRRAKR